ncbi:MAG: glycosyltransferase family 39 protein [Gammaproteobacteria bacterium]|nr:glycosyltransferase family 39 protein [Gammaproteobacteria bacterium]
MNRQPLSTRHILLIVFALIVLLRLITMGLYPLMDTTEARYAEMARKMVETGNWITPQFDYGVPFWGKPPLSIWLTASSFSLFGINEFTARLAHLLPAGLVLWLTYQLARHRQTNNSALLGITLLSGSLLFFGIAAGVMTESALLFSTTLAMLAFWRAMDESRAPNKNWGYLFFAALGIGMLAKGPVAVVLILMPIGLWVLWHNRWSRLWQSAPWIGGTLLMLAICLPWYLLAESRTPGFLEYFIVGEHWKRFLEPGWSGDLYGEAHTQPKGTIWLLWIISAFPWSLWVIAYLLKKPFTKTPPLSLNTPWRSYFLLWSITPMLFFSMAGNVLLTYVITALPALVILLSDFWGASQEQSSKQRISSALILSLLIAPLIFSFFVASQQTLMRHDFSQIELLKTYNELSQNGKNGQLIALYQRQHSGEFYSQGQIPLLKEETKIALQLTQPNRDFYIIEERDYQRRLNESQRVQLEKIEQYGLFYLLRKKP